VTNLDTGIGIYGGLFHITAITHSFVVFISILGIIILQLSSFYPRRIYNIAIDYIYKNRLQLKNIDKYDLIGEQIRIIEYPLVILFILIGAMFLMSSCDLVSMFLSIELQSYGLYILATLYRNSEYATSAGLTYFLLGGLSSCFILLGSSLLYVNTGVTYLDGIYVLYSLSDSISSEYLTINYDLVKEKGKKLNEIYSNQPFNLALLILSVGYLFKVSSAPFHFWSPDVYDSLPTIVTTFVAIIAKISIFIFILDLVHYAKDRKSEFSWTDILRSDPGNHSAWDQLSNSGDALKLLIPNYSRKTISGWINYSCMVISQKMIEKEMGNRGSKSITCFKNVIVKEQRVNGSWQGNNTPCLRCTLMGFEGNYQVKILSKQINKWRSLNTLAAPQPKITPGSLDLLNAYFVTGFTDGEGCFSIIIGKSPQYKTGWKVQAIFEISLHKKDLAILEKIKYYFGGVGNITKHGKDCVHIRVISKTDLSQIIDHFNKYPLLTQKLADFLLFKKAVDLIDRKEHLTIEGLQKIVAIKAAINRGLSDELKAAFPNIVPMIRPLIVEQVIKNPNWVSGFTSGEGCFLINIYKSLTKLGESVKLIFTLTQHSKHELLMKSLIEFFGAGNVYKSREAIDFKITKIEDITDKLIPFFDKYKIVGVKSLDYQDFKKVAELMNNKAHLTSEGLEEIRNE
jgi:hypothetical protein